MKSNKKIIEYIKNNLDGGGDYIGSDKSIDIHHIENSKTIVRVYAPYPNQNELLKVFTTKQIRTL